MKNNNSFYETQIIAMEAHITKLEFDRDLESMKPATSTRLLIVKGFNQMIEDLENWVNHLESKIV